MARVDVRKTYKLYVGGAFPRSESGRSYEVQRADGSFLANAARASRKDLRDAVVAARKGLDAWSAATAYNRGQVLYRVAEMMEARRSDLVESVVDAEGKRGAAAQVDAAIDAWVYYAGWADKLTQVTGGLNPVAGPYFNLTAPEPVGIVGIVAPQTPSLAGLVARLAPVLCGGNAVIAIASEAHPLPAIELAECLATADLPAGAVNIVSGLHGELVPVLAKHLDVDALDVTGLGESDLEETERHAAANVKRLVRAGSPGPYEVTAFMEMKTVWHTKGA